MPRSSSFAVAPSPAEETELRRRAGKYTLPYFQVQRAKISWLNQIEIYFSIVQRKVLTPNDFPNLNAVAERLLDFQYYWATAAQPFEWKFTRRDLDELLVKLSPLR
jgi:hypothetical protein